MDKVLWPKAHIGDVRRSAQASRVRSSPDRRKLDGMSPTGNHQGVIAQAAAQEYVSLDDIFRVAEGAVRCRSSLSGTASRTRIIWCHHPFGRDRAHTALSSREAQSCRS